MEYPIELPSGLEQVGDVETNTRHRVRLATWSTGPNVRALALPLCRVSDASQFTQWLTLNINPETKMEAFWEIAVDVEQIPASNEVRILPKRLIGNVTILVRADYLVIHHVRNPDKVIMKLPGFEFPLRDQYVELDADTVLQLPERYTVMVLAGAKR